MRRTNRFCARGRNGKTASGRFDALVDMKTVNLVMLRASLSRELRYELLQKGWTFHGSDRDAIARTELEPYLIQNLTFRMMEEMGHRDRRLFRW